MLVLSRSVSDRVVFPDLGISVEVLKSRGDRVSLGIDAPRHIRVVRHELLEALPVDGNRVAQDSSDQNAGRPEVSPQAGNALLIQRSKQVSRLVESGATDEAISEVRKLLAVLTEASLENDVSERQRSVETVSEPKASFAIESTNGEAASPRKTPKSRRDLPSILAQKFRPTVPAATGMN